MLLGLLGSVCVSINAQSTCQDIDPQACQLMHTQNPEICFDPAISSTACPRYCNKCALTCYFCDLDLSSPEECNTTMTCGDGESCLTQTNGSSDGTDIYTLGCARQEVCNGQGTGSELVGKRDLTISCCTSDLCNGPATSTLPTTTVTMPTTKTTTVTVTPVASTTTDKYSCARDLIFVVDESTSMALVFPTVQQFIADLVSKLTIGPSDTMVSMATFALLPHKRWDLNRYTNKQQLLSAIMGIKPNLAINSDGLVGLNYVINHVVQSRFGDRPNIPDDVIFISDGSWHKNFLSFLTGKDDQHTVVEELHRDSNNVISIGIGPADTNMIHNVATNTAHSFKVQQASQLASIEAGVLNLICQ